MDQTNQSPLPTSGPSHGSGEVLESRAAAGCATGFFPSGSNFVPKRLLFVRHGETPMTAQRRFVGGTDLPLSADGRAQAERIAPIVRGRRPEACLCSPMRRCLETSEAILTGSSLAAETIDDLREIRFGDWETRTFSEVAASDPEGIARWGKFDHEFAFGSGERIGAFLGRMARVAARIAAFPAERILVVAHGGVIRTLLCHYFGLEIRHFFTFEISPASLTEVVLFEPDKGVLTGLTVCPDAEDAP